MSHEEATAPDPAAPADGRRRRWTRRKLLKRLVLYPLGAVTVAGVGGAAYTSATGYRRGEPQSGHLALTGATVLVGEDLDPLREATVVIEDGVITDVGRDVFVPTGAQVVDLGGYTLMPGLMDLHVHLGSPDRGPLGMPRLIIDWMRDFAGRRRACLEHGVTTIRSLGDEYEMITDVRRKITEGELEGPRLFAAGPLFTTPGGHPIVTFGDPDDPESESVRLPSTPDEARRMVGELANGDRRVDVIKIVQERGTPEFPMQPHEPEVLRAIVTEAHEHDLPVTAHWGTLDDLDDVFAAGVDSLEHVESRGALDGWPDGLLDELVDRGVTLSPTLAVSDAAEPVTPEFHQRLRQRVGEFHAAGGRIVVGTDPPMQGLAFGVSVHRELELLVDSGLTPREALRAATSEAARVLRAEAIGAVETGRAADLLVVDGDPLTEITDTHNVVAVFRDGRLVVDNRD